MHKDIIRLVYYQRIAFLAVVCFGLGLVFGEKVLTDGEWERRANFADIEKIILSWSNVLFQQTGYVPAIEEVRYERDYHPFEVNEDPKPLGQHQLKELDGFHSYWFHSGFTPEYTAFGPKLTFVTHSFRRAFLFVITALHSDKELEEGTHVKAGDVIGRYVTKLQWYMPYRDLDNLLIHYCQLEGNTRCEDVVRHEMLTQKTVRIKIVPAPYSSFVFSLGLFFLVWWNTLKELKSVTRGDHVPAVDILTLHTRTFFAVFPHKVLALGLEKFHERAEEMRKKRLFKTMHSERIKRVSRYLSLVPPEKKDEAMFLLEKISGDEKIIGKEYASVIVGLKAMIPKESNGSTRIDRELREKQRANTRQVLHKKRAVVLKYANIHPESTIKQKARAALRESDTLQVEFFNRPQKALHALDVFLNGLKEKNRLKGEKFGE